MAKSNDYEEDKIFEIELSASGRPSRSMRLIEDAFSIEQEDVRKAGAMGYMARTLAQATLPHTDPKLPSGMLYTRDTGKLTLSVVPSSKRHGIPYGSIPRLILAWLCTEAVRTKNRHLSLGNSQAEFMSRIGLYNNGTDIRRFKDQALRLFKALISVEFYENFEYSSRLLISDSARVFWHPKDSGQQGLWDSSLDLSEGFYKEIISTPVPIDMRVFNALSKSPLAMDIYTWLTYRMFVLRRSGKTHTMIPWVALKLQFGAGYSNTNRGLLDFKSKFKKRLKEVLLFYKDAEPYINEKTDGLLLKPCRLHIPQKRGTLSPPVK